MIESDDIEKEELRLSSQQAAEYGLALLNEKKFLEVQYGELETQYELLKFENEELKNQLKTSQINKHEDILKGKTNEESLLNEKEIYEECLINKIKSHEQEVHSLQKDNERLYIENKNILFNSQELNQNIEELNQLNQKLKYDLKEQERLLIDANTELVEENVLLQEQIEKLGKNLINYDRLNVENKQLKENIDQLQQMMKDLESLKIIAESQLIELHETLREERKQKHIYKQELDDYVQKESLQNLNYLRMKIDDTHANSHDRYLNSCGDVDAEDDDASHMLSSIAYSHTSESDQQLTGNLFSEIHVNETRKLEQKCFELSHIKSSLDNQLLTINEKIKILSSKIEHMNKKIFPDKILSNQFNFDDTDNLLTISIDSIEQIDQDLNLKLKQYNDTQIILIKTHENLINLSEELETIHSYISNSNDIQLKKQQLINFDKKIFDPTVNEHLLNILHEQIQQLKQSFEKNQLSINNQSNQDQINKQNLLLTTKHEQINTLRKLLKESKETSEFALTNLKSTYENEKLIFIETISKLRSELKILKEEAARFSTIRAILAARCDEYVIQLNEYQKKIQGADEEKKTLNSLLRMVIDQKLVLTEKLQRFEINNDRSSHSPNLPRRINNYDLPQDLLSIASNQNNSNLIPERGRFLLPLPSIRSTFPTNRN